MSKNTALFAAVVFVRLSFPSMCQAIDITPSNGGGPTAQQLAENIADTAGGVTVAAIPPAVTTINNPSQGNPSSDDRAMGTFQNGILKTNKSLPTGNGGPTETYVGGIDIDTGVCLCTGVVSDSLATAGQNLGFGVEGPNNGDGEGIFFSTSQQAIVNHTGEITTQLFVVGGSPNPFVDQDFEEKVFPGVIPAPGGGDPTVLQFDVVITEPGFLRISFVFGSDEFPAYVDPDEFDFNDSVAIIINDENIATTTVNNVVSPFNLFNVSDCPKLFVKNDTAPLPVELTKGYVDPVEGPLPNLHAIPAVGNYDIEFGGFTKKLTRETSCVMAPGTYTVKIVIQDVADQRVDAGVFLEENSLKLFSFLLGDADLDGFVGQADLDAVLLNWGDFGKCYTEGDLDGNGQVAQSDLDLVLLNWGNSGGNKNFCSDFNRDGVLDAQDYAIWDRYEGELTSCAARFEGDANGDGKVDSLDFDIFSQEVISGNPSGLCNNDCCGAQMVMAGGGGESAASSEALIAAHLGKLDIDEDQDFDGDDISLWKAKLGAAEK